MKLIQGVKPNNPPYDPYQELAIAVIKQAAEDFRTIGKRLESNVSDFEKQQLEQAMQSIRLFFLSDWYQAFSGFDNGPMILEMLDREASEND